MCTYPDVRVWLLLVNTLSGPTTSFSTRHLDWTQIFDYSDIHSLGTISAWAPDGAVWTSLFDYCTSSGSQNGIRDSLTDYKQVMEKEMVKGKRAWLSPSVWCQPHEGGATDLKMLLIRAFKKCVLYLRKRSIPQTSMLTFLYFHFSGKDK